MTPTGNDRWKNLVDGATTTVILATCCALLWAVIEAPRPAKRPSPTVPTKPVAIGGAPSEGNSAARVVVIEYEDFQCPFCGAFERTTMPRLLADYISAGKVLLVFRHHPLTRIHPLANGAAEVAACADRQGRFWEVEHSVFEDQQAIQRSALLDKVSGLGLDRELLETCLGKDNVDQVDQLVQRDTNQAESFGLSATPSFLIGSKTDDGSVKVAEVLSGAVSYQAISASLDKVLRTVVSAKGR
jgi:protein-disulfide isomerase